MVRLPPPHVQCLFLISVAFIFSFISHLFTEYFSEETTRTLFRSQEAHQCGLVTFLNIAQLEQNKTTELPCSTLVFLCMEIKLKCNLSAKYVHHDGDAKKENITNKIQYSYVWQHIISSFY